MNALRSRPLLAVAILACALGGCGMLPSLNGGDSTPKDPNPLDATKSAETLDRPDLLTAVDLSAAVTPLTLPVGLSAGRNEWVSVVLRVRTPAAGERATLSLPVWASDKVPLKGRGVRAYQVLPMPLDVNRASYVRQTGANVAAESLPRALLPIEATDGRIDLTKLRDPVHPTDPTATAAGGEVLVWLDLRVGIDATPGKYAAQVVYRSEANDDAPAKTQATLAVGLDVADFVLPDDRHLSMVADLPWDRLRKLWPDRFEAVRPQLLDRDDERVKPAVATLDALVNLAQENRVQVHVPKLQPVVKFLPGRPVQVDWDDYDALIGPWLSGQAFADRVPMGFWAIPRVEYLDNVIGPLQVAYYTTAAAHFDQRDWLRTSPVVLTQPTKGRATLAERFLLSAEAARVLKSHPRVRVMLPVEPAEVQFAAANNPDLIDEATTARLICVAPGLISDSAMLAWPPNLAKPQNWLRTDLSGLIPYTGAGGDEGDVRTWAWTAFLRRANLIQWDACLPIENEAKTPADPNELVWFYPGSWFGVDDPVATVQIKWLRRAQQDFEYLRLAEQRGSLLNVLPMARLMAKPVEIQPDQSPDAVYGLLLGTADAGAWSGIKPILTHTIQARGPGIEENSDTINDLNQETLRWMEPLERPVILPRRTDWTVGAPPAGEVGPWVNLRLGFDLYNASDTTPEQNQLLFKVVSAGWKVDFAAVIIPKLSMFQVTRQGLNARINPAEVDNAHHRPTRINYRSGQTGAETPLDVVAPVARSVRRTEPGPFLNGSLDDWQGDDAIQVGPLVRMMNRSSVQAHALTAASTPTQVYSSWGDDDFYAAFRVEGVGRGKPKAARNFVEYQSGRAWGEDVCQAIVQGVYDDGTVGPQVHVAVKPGGNVWVEKRSKGNAPWQPFASGVRYATTLDGQVWRGELAVPWAELIDPAKTDAFAREGRPNRPTVLKFNFIQHKRETGESASWAGPVDAGAGRRVHGRDRVERAAIATAEKFEKLTGFWPTSDCAGGRTTRWPSPPRA